MREPLHRKLASTADREPAARGGAQAKPADNAATDAPASAWQRSPHLVAQRQRIDAGFGSTALQAETTEHESPQAATAAIAATPFPVQAVKQRTAAVVQLGRNQYGGNPLGRGGKGGYRPAPKGSRQVHKRQQAVEESRRRRNIGQHAFPTPAPTP